MRRIEHLVFTAYRGGDEGLAIYRIVFGAVMLLFLLPSFDWASDLPSSFFDPPPGPFELLPGVPPRAVLLAIEALLVFATVAILVGWRTVAASWTFAIAWVLGAGVTFSFGKIDHVLVPVIAAPLLAAAGWGRTWSLDARSDRAGPLRAWPIALFAWLLAIMMFSAALPKLRTGWLEPSSQVIQGVLYRQYHVFGRTDLLASPALDVRSRVLWEGVDVSIVVLEAIFVIAFLSPRTMRLACAAAVLFHLGVLLTANIPFTSNVLAYGVFFALLVPASGRVRPLPAWTGPAAIAVAIGTALVQQASNYAPGLALVDALTDRSGIIVSVVLIGVGTAFAVAYLGRSALALARTRTS